MHNIHYACICVAAGDNGHTLLSQSCRHNGYFLFCCLMLCGCYFILELVFISILIFDCVATRFEESVCLSKYILSEFTFEASRVVLL